VYEKGSLADLKGKRIAGEIIEKETRKGFEVGAIDRFRCRSRYFTDSGIIGSKRFVERCYEMFQTDEDPPEKSMKAVKGLEGVFSLKRLSEFAPPS
jgi:hypothetical protein